MLEKKWQTEPREQKDAGKFRSCLEERRRHEESDSGEGKETSKLEFLDIRGDLYNEEMESREFDYEEILEQES